MIKKTTKQKHKKMRRILSKISVVVLVLMTSSLVVMAQDTDSLKAQSADTARAAGVADAAAAETNAKLVFKTLPSWNTTTGYFEGTFNDDAADKQSALYEVTVPVPGETSKYLTYKILFTKDLSSYAARKYTRQSYYFRTKQ